MSVNSFICTICEDVFDLESKHKNYRRCIPCVSEQRKMQLQEKSQTDEYKEKERMRTETNKDKKREQARNYRAKHKDEINEKNHQKRMNDCGMSEEEIKYVNEKFDILTTMRTCSFETKYELTPKKKRWFIRDFYYRLRPHELEKLNYDDSLFNTSSSGSVSEN